MCRPFINAVKFLFCSKCILIFACWVAVSSLHGATVTKDTTELVKSASKLQKQRQLGDKFLIWDETAIWLGTGCGIEFNDNIQLSENNKKSDIIFRPNLFVSIERRFTEINTLNISSKLGFSYYLKHTENNTRLLTVSPDSALVYTFKVNTINITVTDAFSFEEDPTSSPTLSEVSVYRRYSNGFSITPSWEINPQWDTRITFSYDLLRTIGSDFNEQDRDSYTIAYRLNYKPSTGFSIGPFLSTTTTKYRRKIQNDSDGGTVGANISYRISEYLSMKWFVGQDLTSFKKTGSENDSEKAKNITFNGSIKHRLSPHSSHSIGMEGGIRPGFGTNFFNDKKYTYNFDTQINSFTQALVTLFYQTLTESGTTGESAYRMALLLNTNFAILKNASLGFGYRFLKKSSDKPNKSYIENKLTFDFSYAF